jgi:hypothetical protein
MKALHHAVTTVVLLAVLAILPAAMISFRMMVNQMHAAIPRPASAIDEADFWLRTFAP